MYKLREEIDLIFSFGKIHREVIESSWQEAVKTSGVDSIPGELQKEKLTKDLLELSPKFIATGHGPCVKLWKGKELEKG